MSALARIAGDYDVCLIVCQLNGITKVNNWLKNIQSWCWPQHCRLCGEGSLAIDESLCAACLQDLPWNQSCCEVCALPLPHSGVCGECQRKLPPYHRAIASFYYAEPIVHLVHGLKYGKRLEYGRFLGEQLIKTLESSQDLILPDCLVPVPLHRKRFLERGYNQAHEISRPIAKHFSVSIVENASIERCRDTPEQSQLTAKQRKQNLKGAFKVNRDVSGLRIAIVDDVMTTGTTASELSRVLIRAGARRVEIWLATRAASDYSMSKT